MALAINIDELIHGRVIEWERLEFKKGWNPEDVLHTICAFANDMNNWGGGYIVIGIGENNGRPVFPPAGLNPNQIDRIQGELTGLCHFLQPNYLPISQPIFFKDRHILIIYAQAGDMRPYSAPGSLGGKSPKNRFYFIHSGSRTIRASGDNLRRLQELSARIPYDDRKNWQAELNDLNLGLMRDFLQEVKSGLFEESITTPFADLCRQMAIAKGPNENLLPINVGLLFFSLQPHHFFQRAWIEVVLRKDEAGKDFEEKYFKGPLHIQLKEALRFIKTNVITEKTVKVPGQAKANRWFNYPFEALEEALANAVYHKSYELGNPIEVQIWPDKIEILSFPGPIPPVNAKILSENRRVVVRQYRNRRVGDFLKELHLTEGRGTGIPTIKKFMRENESPEAIFETDEQCTYFLTVLPINVEVGKLQNVQVGDQDSAQDSDQDGNQVGAQDSAQNSAQNSAQYGDQDGVIDSVQDSAQNSAEYGVQDSDQDSVIDSDQDSDQDGDQDGVIDSAQNSAEYGNQDSVQDSVQDGDQVGVQDSDQDSDQDGDQVSDQDVKQIDKILKYCLKSKSRVEILLELGLSNHTKNYKKHIEPLIIKDYITMTIPDKPTSKNQKYVTTRKGKRQLAKLKYK